jgi:hypothetical protein
MKECIISAKRGTVSLAGSRWPVNVSSLPSSAPLEEVSQELALGSEGRGLAGDTGEILNLGEEKDRTRS